MSPRKPFTLPKIYPITDVQLSGLPHAEQLVLFAEAGAVLVQLREKYQPAGVFYSDAVAAMRVARQRGVNLIINDRVDLASAVGADGVHLGQDDLPPEAARKLLGAEALIGFSTHSVEQAIRAKNLPIDYLAIGPIFSTTTKQNPDPVVGLDGLNAVRDAVDGLPIVAIGGIAAEQVEQVLQAGANSVALISAFWRDPSKIAAIFSSYP